MYLKALILKNDTKARYINEISVLYIFAFGLMVFMPQYKTVIGALLVGINLVAVAVNSQNFPICLLSSFVLGGESICALNTIIVLAVISNKGKLVLKKTEKKVWFAIAIILIYSMMNAVQYETYINVIFSISYLLLLLLVCMYVKDKIDSVSLVFVVKTFVRIEFIVSLLIAIKARSILPGDVFSGSLSSAHFFGCWLVYSLLLIYSNAIKSQGMNFITAFQKNAFDTIIIIFMLYLSESKAVNLLFALAIIFYICLELAKLERTKDIIFVGTICLYVALYLLLGILFLDPVRKVITNLTATHIATYIYSSGWNYKFEYFRGTLYDEMKGIHLLIGYGLGQYGSRFAGLFAYNTMYRKNSFINNFVASNFSQHIVPQYAKYISYYDKELVANIGWRSAILTYPFSSLISIIAELGVLGMLIFAKVLNELFKDSYAKVIYFCFLFFCFSDNYFDYFNCVGYVLILMLNTNLNK